MNTMSLSRRSNWISWQKKLMILWSKKRTFLQLKNRT